MYDHTTFSKSLREREERGQMSKSKVQLSNVNIELLSHQTITKREGKYATLL